MRHLNHLTTYVRSKAVAFARDESGATAIEYGLIAVGVFLAIIISVQALGTAVQGPFNKVASGLQ